VASSFLDPMLKSPAMPWVLRNLRSQAVLARSLETAFDSPSRRKGLLGRAALGGDSALILAPCSGIHTFFMRFAIDAVFVRRNGSVLRVLREVAPWRIGLAPKAFAVVELSSGAANRADTRPGDILQLESE
jgi:uncharacterized membrane protein (UPF0127 family)